ncbi:MAG TPA: hypothetical protein VFY68_15645 [Nitrososphaeraceae archaeon]|nr:hypothetical protein [Nitrososphaeraceae archaeon]
METSLIVLAAIVVAALIIFVAMELSATESATAAAAAAAAAAAVSADAAGAAAANIEARPSTTSGLVKRKDQETDTDRKLSIIELRIGCGLENPQVIERETSRSDKNIIIGDLTEMEQKFSQVINRILENREKLKSIERDVEFIEWCQEANEDPDMILSKISEDVIGKFLGSIEPYFQNLMLSKISVESDISVTKDSPKRIRKNITFSLKPIEAYIELVIYSDGQRVSSTKFIFTITSYVKIKNLTVYLEKVNRDQAQQEQQSPPYRHKKVSNNSNALRRRIRVENLLIGIRVQLTKMKIGNLEKKTIQPPLDIGKKEAEIESILFFS